MIQIQDSGRTATELTRLLGLVGSVVPKLDEVVVPTVLVGDVSQSAPPGIIRSASAALSIAAVAATLPLIRMTCPAGTLAVVRSVWFGPTTATSVLARFGAVITPAAGGGDVVDAALLDGRLRALGQAPGVSFLFGTTGTQLVDQIWQQAFPAAGASFGPVPTPGFILAGGQAIEFQAQAVADALLASIVWTEFQVA